MRIETTEKSYVMQLEATEKEIAELCQQINSLYKAVVMNPGVYSQYKKIFAFKDLLVLAADNS